MCGVFWSCLKQAAVLVRSVWLLLLTPVVFFFFGFWGTYDEVFGGANLRTNTTVALEHGLEVVRNYYTIGEWPHAFLLWGGLAAAIYVALILFYLLFSCLGICHACSKELDARGDALRRHHHERHHQKLAEENEAYEIELEQLRRETQRYREESQIPMDF